MGTLRGAIVISATAPAMAMAAIARFLHARNVQLTLSHGCRSPPNNSSWLD